MVVRIKFLTGKEIELTDSELRELYGNPFYQPYQPWQVYPYPYGQTVYGSGTATIMNCNSTSES